MEGEKIAEKISFSLLFTYFIQSDHGMSLCEFLWNTLKKKTRFPHTLLKVGSDTGSLCVIQLPMTPGNVMNLIVLLAVLKDCINLFLH